MHASPDIVIIGAGPAGLIAAEHLAESGLSVVVAERMPSPARKFLLAGRGGLNLTHSEPLDRFLDRYGPARAALEPALRAFPPDALRAWADGLGEETRIGTSGRVFPKSFKATPLLRGWLRRLDTLGVRFALSHCWQGWTADGALAFATPAGPVALRPRATLLALGGASWPRLGADGGWVPLLAAQGVTVVPLMPSNVGVLCPWSPALRERFHGAPLKGCAFAVGGSRSRAEAVITREGLEGGAIYALSAALRAALADGPTRLAVDLKPDVAVDALARRLAAGKPGDSLANLLRKKAGLSPAAIALLREAGPSPLPRAPDALAAALKALSVPVTGLGGIDRAISTAGGIALSGLDAGFQLRALPGIYAAGEMLDIDAPTGGYLLQSAFSTGMAAATAIRRALTGI